jgi:hypothetical protein
MSSLFDRFFKGKTTLPTPGSKEVLQDGHRWENF